MRVLILKTRTWTGYGNRTIVKAGTVIELEETQASRNGQYYSFYLPDHRLAMIRMSDVRVISPLEELALCVED